MIMTSTDTPVTQIWSLGANSKTAFEFWNVILAAWSKVKVASIFRWRSKDYWWALAIIFFILSAKDSIHLVTLSWQVLGKNLSKIHWRAKQNGAWHSALQGHEPSLTTALWGRMLSESHVTDVDSELKRKVRRDGINTDKTSWGAFMELKEHSSHSADTNPATVGTQLSLHDSSCQSQGGIVILIKTLLQKTHMLRKKKSQIHGTRVPENI